MADFKSKEEYEKWKAMRISNLKANPNALKEVAVARDIYMGEYLHGFSKSKSAKGVRCRIDENDFIFSHDNGELDRIPRNMLDKVEIVDKTEVTRAALNPAGLLIGGTLGAVMTTAGHEIKNKRFYVTIDWGNTKGLKNSTVFAFEGKDSLACANDAVNYLKRYARGNSSSPGADEKICPYCAETIKAAAIVCRYCKKDL